MPEGPDEAPAGRQVRTRRSPPGNPYPGLEPFTAERSQLFFGREAELRAMLAKLGPSRLCALVGAAGSGKTSLLQAGLLPALRNGHTTVHGSRWRIAMTSPGRRPIANLARALCVAGELEVEQGKTTTKSDTSAGLSPAARELDELLRGGKSGLVEAAQHHLLAAGEQLVIVLDHFESLLAMRGDPRRAEEAELLVSALLLAMEQREVPIFVVLSLRSESQGQCVQYRGLPEAVHRAQVWLGELAGHGLRSAIEQPLVNIGLEADEGLVQQLLVDHETRGRHLSRLQHALNRCFAVWRAQAKTSRQLKLEDYQAIGGLERALERHAEESLAEVEREFGPAGLDVTERIFRGLTGRDAEGRNFCRSSELPELLALTGAEKTLFAKVLSHFGKPGRAFLRMEGRRGQPSNILRLGFDTVLEAWPRLSTWIDHEQALARELYVLWDAQQREANGQAGLWRNPELQSAIRWQEEQRITAAQAQRYGIDLAAINRFLERSQAALDSAAKAEAEEWGARLAHATGETTGESPPNVALPPAPVSTGQGRSWLGRIGLTLLLLAAAGGAGYSLWEQRQTEAQLNQALEESRRARKRSQQTKALLDRAEDDRIAAERQRKLAERSLQDAKAVAARAEAARKAALEQQRLALEQKQAVEAERGAAVARSVHARALAALSLASLATKNPMERIALLREAPAEVSERLPGWAQAAAHALWDMGRAESLLSGHLGAINMVRFSPDGRYVLTGSGDTTAQLWLADGSGSPRELAGHTRAIRAARFSPDGRYAASAGEDATIRVWRVDEPSPPLVLDDHQSPITDLQFTPDSRFIVTCSSDEEVRIWPSDGQGRVRTLKAGAHGYASLALSHDGRWVAAGGSDNTVYLWPFSGEDSGASLMGHAGEVHGLLFSPDDSLLLSIADDRVARLWRFAGSDSSAAEHHQLVGHLGALTSADFSPDGKHVVTGSADDTARIWPVDGASPAIVLRGHAGPVRAVAFGGDGRTVVTGSDDQTARLWQTQDGQLQLTLRGHQAAVRSVDFDAKGERVVTGSADDTARVWRLKSIEEPRILRGPDAAVYALAYDAKGKRLAAGDDDGQIWLWPLETATSQVPVDGQPIGRHDGAVTGLAFDPSGQHLASASEDDTGRIWKLPASDGADATYVELTGHGDDVTSVAFHPDGQQVATGSDDKSVKLWSLAGQLVHTWAEHGDVVKAVAYSPNGKRVASAAADGVLRIWKNRGQRRAAPVQLTGAPQALNSVAFHPDGDYVLAAGEDHVLRIWPVDGSEGAVEYTGHQKDASSVAFNASGSRFVSGSYDGTARVWPTNGTEQAFVLKGHKAEVYAVAYHPTREQVATASQDTTIQLWSLENWHRRLWRASAHCLPPLRRVILFGETDSEAVTAHEACVAEVERRRGTVAGFPAVPGASAAPTPPKAEDKDAARPATEEGDATEAAGDPSPDTEPSPKPNTKTDTKPDTGPNKDTEN